jgi:transcriptional regulator with XRE-family HTH domain
MADKRERGAPSPKDTSVAGFFGRQLKKERVARGWRLIDLSARLIAAMEEDGEKACADAPQLSRVERGRRAPTEALANACDRVFDTTWFGDLYRDSREWHKEIPPGMRDWQEFESKATRIHVWCPSIFHGLLQTQDYARALLATLPGATSAEIAIRLKARVVRQQVLTDRTVLFLIDELALFREVGSPAVMVDQLVHVQDIASQPNITVQILPAVAHPANASGLIVTDSAGYCEHVVAGGVYADPETVGILTARWDSLRCESYRVSESAAMIGRMRELWTGGNPLTQMLTAEIA